MGSVYLAEDTQLKRPVALKVPDFGTQTAPRRGNGSWKRPAPPPRSTTPTSAPSMTPGKSMASLT